MKGGETVSLLKYSGNTLTPHEKTNHLRGLRTRLMENAIDEEFVELLDDLNQLPVVSTECCCGHGKKGNSAYVVIRSMFDIETMVDSVIRPLCNDFQETSVRLSTECQMLFYVFRFPSAKMKDIVGAIGQYLLMID